MGEEMTFLPYAAILGVLPSESQIRSAVFDFEKRGNTAELDRFSNRNKQIKTVKDGMFYIKNSVNSIDSKITRFCRNVNIRNRPSTKYYLQQTAKRDIRNWMGKMAMMGGLVAWVGGDKSEESLSSLANMFEIYSIYGIDFSETESEINSFRSAASATGISTRRWRQRARRRGRQRNMPGSRTN